MTPLCITTDSVSKSIVAIVGGIGSGKSLVSRVLRLLGYEVYDCDSRAKALMNTSPIIKRQLIDAFGEDVFTSDGTVNRQVLAQIIFSNKAALERVNAIVHPQVIADILRTADVVSQQPLFVETAIPHQSGIDGLAHSLWLVDAPIDVRIARVIARDGASRSQVVARINSQDFSQLCNPHIHRIVNDGSLALIPQITKLLLSLPK